MLKAERSTPPSLTTSWLPPPTTPTARSVRLLQREPFPVTRAKLLLLPAFLPRKPVLLSRNAPLLTISRLKGPLLPTNSEPPMRQRPVELMSWTSLDLAVAVRPMIPFTELVSSALSESTSNVNERLVPTVTSPVMLVVTLLNVLVAPSATICARRGGEAASSDTATSKVLIRCRGAIF